VLANRPGSLCHRHFQPAGDTKPPTPDRVHPAQSSAWGISGKGTAGRGLQAAARPERAAASSALARYTRTVTRQMMGGCW